MEIKKALRIGCNKLLFTRPETKFMKSLFVVITCIEQRMLSRLVHDCLRRQNYKKTRLGGSAEKSFERSKNNHLFAAIISR